MAEAYGNVVQHWQTYISAYIVSQDNTRALVRCDCYHHSIGWGYGVGGTGEAKVAGQSSGQVHTTFNSYTGQTRNQYITRKDVYINKGHGGQNVYCEGIVQTTGGYHNGTSVAGTNVWVGAKPSYTVSYNANGGSGAPGNQIKWYGENLTISSSKPVLDGHDFLYWTVGSVGGSVKLNPGSSYTSNGGATLYANWKAHTYSVKYNANGGTGAPTDQTKTYGETLRLSSTIPTRKNYNFLGWGLSSGSTTVTFAAGDDYTSNRPITLYAIWELAWVEPRILNLQADRCDSAGTLKEDGQYARISFNWVTDRTVKTIYIECNGDTTYIGGVTGNNGTVDKVLGDNAFDTEKSYRVTVYIEDQVDGAYFSTTIAAMNYIIDFAPNGSVAFGMPANPDTERIDVNLPMVSSEYIEASKLYLGISTGASKTTIHTVDTFEMVAGNGNKMVSYGNDLRLNIHKNVGLENGRWLQGQAKPDSDDYVDLLRVNEEQQVELNWTSGGLRGRCMKLLWEGSWSSGSITVPELPYYNVLLFESSNTVMGSVSILAAKVNKTPAKNGRWICGSSAMFEQSSVNHVVGVEFIWKGSETTLSCTPAAAKNYPIRSVGVGSGQGAGFITGLPIERIYGVL